MIDKNGIETLFDDIKKNHPLLIERIEKGTKLSSNSSELLLKEVLRFLFLITKHNRTLSPSILIDLAWHEMILFTRLYESICNKNFGRFIHHTPSGDDKENQQRYKTTLKLYALTFGDLPEEFWGKEVEEYNENASCGSCQSN